MVTPQMLRVMEYYVKEARGAVGQVPLEAYDGAFDAVQARAAREIAFVRENPTALKKWTQEACAAIARQYPRPKAYAKKRAVR